MVSVLISRLSSLGLRPPAGVTVLCSWARHITLTPGGGGGHSLIWAI